MCNRSMKPLKCEMCGAPLTGSKCEYCGTVYADEMIYPKDIRQNCCCEMRSSTGKVLINIDPPCFGVTSQDVITAINDWRRMIK